jgi:imidazole glycerol-phosphate synthase subunit HisF
VSLSRIIARLDIKGPNLVKGIHLEGLRVLGKPWAFARTYYEEGVDELFFQDSVASLYERNSLNDIISRTAKGVFVPLTVGGGIRDLKDISNVLRNGADKVAINTAAIKNPKFVGEAVREYGSANITVSIEAGHCGDNKYHAFLNYGREDSGVDVVEWAKIMEQMGAGEVILTSIDRDGTGSGFDLELCTEVADSLSIPVIAHGGASCVDHIEEVLRKANVSGVALASMLHYGVGQQKIEDLDEVTEEGNRSFISNPRRFKNFSEISIGEIKSELVKRGIDARE